MFTLKKLFEMFGGLSYRQPDLLPNEAKATVTNNVSLSEQYALTKRRGYKHLLSGVGGSGVFTYNNTDVGTGISTVERLIADSQLHKLVYEEISIYLELTPDPSPPDFEPYTNWVTNLTLRKDGNFYLSIYTNGTEQYSFNLGTGEEVSPVTLADLKNDLESNTSYKLNTDSGNLGLPAALILPTYDLSNSAPIEKDYGSGNIWASETILSIVTHETIPSVDVYTSAAVSNEAIPFTNHFSNKDNIDWELINSVQANDVIYFTNKDDGLWKYDGTKILRAGLPVPEISTVSGEGDNNRQYLVVIKYTDDKDNIIRSATSNIIRVDATVNPVNITVDIPNLNTGYDAESSDFIVEIYRTIENGTVFYKLDEKAGLAGAEIFNEEVSFEDDLTVTDEALVENLEFIFPTQEATPPPDCAYMDMWRSQIVLTGNPTEVSTVYVANPTDIEGFSYENSFITQSKWGGPNTGIRQLGNQLFVFKARSISMVTGSVGQGALGLQVDTVTDAGIGALSQQSIIEVNNELYFVASNGLYSVTLDGGIQNISTDLTPIWSLYEFRDTRVISFFWANENKVLFMLPNFSGNAVLPSSTILVLDMISGGWYTWSNFNFVNGISDDRQQIWFQGNSSISEVLNNRMPEDYADHAQPINFVYKTHWEALGDPSIHKKFNRVKIFSKDNELSTFVSNNFSINLKTNHDLSNVTVSDIEVSFGDSSSGYGLGPYGLLPYGGVKLTSQTRRLATKKAGTFRISLENNNLLENVLISGIQLEIASPYQPALKGGE